MALAVVVAGRSNPLEIQDFTRENVKRFVELVEAAEVLAVGFRLFPQRLIFDTRYTEQGPPFLKVVQRVNSVEERLQELAKIRPNFPTPERFYFTVWPHSIESFRETGAWDRILDRCQASGHTSIMKDCDLAWNVLLGLERQEVQQAIRGEGFRTIWEKAK